MKKRNGFVSNSSSTSYIIAIKDLDDVDGVLCECCGMPNINILELVEMFEHQSCDNEVCSTDPIYIAKSLDNWYMDEQKRESIKKEIAKFAKRERWMVAQIDVARSNELLKSVVRAQANAEKIVIINQDDE